MIFAACLGIVWTMGSLAWFFMAPEVFAGRNALDWARVALVLPAFVSVAVGETLYRSGVRHEELGIAFGALLAMLMWIVGLLALARRA